ncbi:hypothetical protein Tco_1309921 [Tanacetum coccineum]
MTLICIRGNQAYSNGDLAKWLKWRIVTEEVLLTLLQMHRSQRSTSSTRWSLANADHLTFVAQGKLASGYVCEVTALGAYHSMLIGSDFLLEHMLLEGCQQTSLDKGISPVRFPKDLL